MDRRRPSTPGRDRGLSTVAVAAGATAWCAGIAASVVPGLLPRVDTAPVWGAAWSVRATGADAIVAAAVGERLALATGLLVLVAALSLFTVLLLLVGGRERRRPGLSVRFALGAGPRTLLAHLLRTDARRLALLFASGLVGGVVAAGGLTATWPGTGLPGQGLGVRGDPLGAAATVAGAAGVGAGALVLVLAFGLLSPLIGLGSRTPVLLRRGHGVTDDPRAGTVRRGAATLQVALSFALAVTGLALVAAKPVGESSAPGTGPGATPTAALAPGPILSPASGPEVDGARPFGRFAVDDPSALRRRTPSGGSTPAPLLATPGAWTGVGVRDLVTVECGACVVGVWYLPVYGVDSTVHAAHPGVLEALGGRVLEGRSIAASDGPEAELVGVVNGAFRRHFEGGAPIGRRIRLPGGGDRWVRVVGVADDPPFRGPGAARPDEPVLWLSLAQHPADEVEGLVGPTPPPGLRRLDGPGSLGEMRRASVAPVAWAGWLLLISGGVALLLALASTAEVARVEARGRARAGAVRLALGAPPHIPAAALVGRAVKSALLGVTLGWAVGLALEAALGVGDRTDLAVRGALALGVLGAALAGTVPRVRALLRLAPATLLREE